MTKKVFVPVCDAMLGAKGELSGELVPFNPEFLSDGARRSKEGRKPANWVSDSDYASACKRLRQSASEG